MKPRPFSWTCALGVMLLSVVVEAAETPDTPEPLPPGGMRASAAFAPGCRRASIRARPVRRSQTPGHGRLR